MFIIVFEAWNGTRTEVHYDEEYAKVRYSNLKEVYTKVKLLKVTGKIEKIGDSSNEV